MWVLMSFVYFIFLIAGTLIVMSSSSWFVIWVGLEMNMMGFIPFVGVRGSGLSDSMFSYFLVQAVGSMVLFFWGLFGGLVGGAWMFMYDLFFSGGLLVAVVALSMGASPFHHWFLSVSNGLGWVDLSLLMTWQSVAPLSLIGVGGWSFWLVCFIGCVSVLVGAFGGLNQMVIKRLMAYSSISHLGWMCILFSLSDKIGFVYFFAYCLVSLGVLSYMFGQGLVHMGQLGVMTSFGHWALGGFGLSLFSLGGLPPFLGFYPSWLGIMTLLGGGYFWLVIFFVFVGLFVLYFYLRMGYSWFLGGPYSGQWIGGGWLGHWVVALLSVISWFMMPFFLLMFL